MQLQLGVLQGGAATNIPIPKPAGSDPSLNASNTIVARTYDALTSTWVNETYYKSYTSYPFDGQDFVFCGIGDSVRLVDINLWQPTATALPYFHRTIVRAEANERVVDPHGTRTLRAAACAQPASVFDPKPSPGALQISFPDGMPGGPEDVNRPRDLYGGPNNLNTAGIGVDMYRSNSGDFPVSGGSSLAADNGSWPVPSDSAQMASTACKIAIYDWLRRAGTKANVTSVVGMHNTPFLTVADPPLGLPLTGTWSGTAVPRGISHIYRFEWDGVVSYEHKELTPQKYYVVAEDQSYMECFRALEQGHPSDGSQDIEITGLNLGPPINAVSDGVVTIGPAYDMFIRIYGRRPGITNGGRHAGEPLDNMYVSQLPTQLKLTGNSGSASVESTVMYGKGAGGHMYGWKNKNKGKSPGPINPGNVGAPPFVIGRQDFMQTTPSTIDTNPVNYEIYGDDPLPATSGTRWTYRNPATIADIRFRRVLDLWKESDLINFESGYIGIR
jgi:hypothetical protein